MFETRRDTEFWRVFWRELPKAAKFGGLVLSLLGDISFSQINGDYYKIV